MYKCIFISIFAHWYYLHDGLYHCLHNCMHIFLHNSKKSSNFADGFGDKGLQADLGDSRKRRIARAI